MIVALNFPLLLAETLPQIMSSGGDFNSDRFLEEQVNQDYNRHGYEQQDDIVCTETLQVMSSRVFQIKAQRYFSIGKTEESLIPFMHMCSPKSDNKSQWIWALSAI